MYQQQLLWLSSSFKSRQPSSRTHMATRLATLTAGQEELCIRNLVSISYNDLVLCGMLAHDVACSDGCSCSPPPTRFIACRARIPLTTSLGTLATLALYSNQDCSSQYLLRTSKFESHRAWQWIWFCSWHGPVHEVVDFNRCRFRPLFDFC